MSLNLARRPFVDTRPVNALTAFLVAVVLVLSVVSWRTFRAYLEGSRGTQAAIAELKDDIAREEAARKQHEAALARYDVAELGLSAEDANEIARRRAFSWTRFLTRLEEVLPHDARVVSIALSRSEHEARSGTPSAQDAGMPLDLVLVTRDPLGLPKIVRALYGSTWFDTPVPHADDSPEKGTPEGRRITLGVTYYDAGRPAPASPLPVAAAATRPARPAPGRSAR
jgi:hypothetical protein